MPTACLPNAWPNACLMHAQRMLNACLMHAQCMPTACLTHGLPYAYRMRNAWPNACLPHAQCMSNACVMHGLTHAYCICTPCLNIATGTWALCANGMEDGRWSYSTLTDDMSKYYRLLMPHIRILIYVGDTDPGISIDVPFIYLCNTSFYMPPEFSSAVGDIKSVLCVRAYMQCSPCMRVYVRACMHVCRRMNT